MQHRIGQQALTGAVCVSVCALLAACSVSVSFGSSHTTTTTTTTSSPPGTSTDTGGSAAGALAWHACGSFRCSKLTVPISYADPGEGTLSLAVIELPAMADPAAAPDLVLNPGGPGESGVQFLQEAFSEFPSALRARFNLVSFDPRGIGGSDPVVCTTPAGLRRWLALDPAPVTPAAIASVTTAVKEFDAGCAANVPRDVLASLSTAVTARDMDRLRAALGQRRLDYLGFSYGTYLGAMYAQAFPSKVGHMVLDGAVDPALSSSVLDLEQADAFELDLHDFFAWCPTNATCTSELPAGAESSYNTLIRRLESGATLTAGLDAALGGTQAINYAVVLTGVISSLYTTTYWPYLAQGLAQATSGNGTVLAELAYSYAGFNANGTASNLLSAELAVSCLDRPSPPVTTLPALARHFATTAPDFGPAEAWGTIGCNYWPVPATGKVGPIQLSEALPILVVGSTHDPATPYAWAQALTSQLNGSELLTRTGDGHTGYFSSTCVQTWVDGYLSTGARPPAGTVCSSNS
jgi:pimeloyl-ACP methyl ester carboxylesterase